MYEELFQSPDVIARYRTGPYAVSREQHLKKANADGYSPATMQRIAWALLIVAEIIDRNGGRVTLEQLRDELRRIIPSKPAGCAPSPHTIKLIIEGAKPWLRSMGALVEASKQPTRFATELAAYKEYMRDEQGLSSVTITSADESMRWFFASLPFEMRSLRAVTIAHIDAFLEGQARRGWRRQSLYRLGCRLRGFLRYAAHQGWCRSDLPHGVGLPFLYALEDVPRAPSVEEVNRLLEDTTADDPVSIRDHAILLLLIDYGLRRGEVARLTLDDLDWATETIHVSRPKMRRAQSYPMSVPAGEAILCYLRRARPASQHRALFLTIQAPIRPLSGHSVTAMVRTRLTRLGVQLDRRGAHCLRHACAGQLLDAGFTLKQIADHLGHRSMDTTRIYTKIDLRGLRQVAEFDLGALL